MRGMIRSFFTASKMLSCPMMFVTRDSVGAVHEVGTKLWAARWKIRSGRS